MLGQLGNGGFAKHAREVSRPPSATWTLPDFLYKQDTCPEQSENSRKTRTVLLHINARASSKLAYIEESNAEDELPARSVTKYVKLAGSGADEGWIDAETQSDWLTSYQSLRSPSARYF
ncbi:hypothetical protein M422DRAFT_269841 [Sphaerobolus stellatus SS14]|uniref:Uncharacterized protein n=1 Tax=Sphaerobolus stellatus (strain SS14) TaxID=990650 RepID=A0A0C9UU07_SPHS4|nr:hypothetical protein M422DRAFT_269841 [Sphaerobolus stellatus SS14]